ncbi:hypothetical protein LZ30DRAFT_137020 [Colletotrichum cereale]|nr:hypothetical protein LZ30DRAFT_137020 [Colletotrichum cereale]
MSCPVLSAEPIDPFAWPLARLPETDDGPAVSLREITLDHHRARMISARGRWFGGFSRTNAPSPLTWIKDNEAVISSSRSTPRPCCVRPPSNISPAVSNLLPRSSPQERPTFGVERGDGRGEKEPEPSLGGRIRRRIKGTAESGGYDGKREQPDVPSDLAPLGRKRLTLSSLSLFLSLSPTSSFISRPRPHSPSPPGTASPRIPESPPSPPPVGLHVGYHAGYPAHVPPQCRQGPARTWGERWAIACHSNNKVSTLTSLETCLSVLSLGSPPPPVTARRKEYRVTDEGRRKEEGHNRVSLLHIHGTA